MKTAAVFILVVILGFAAIYMLTNPKNQSGETNNFLTPTPTANPLETGGDQPQVTPVPTEPEDQRVTAESATITTDKGAFELEFYPEEAPLTVTNFATLAKRGYYNNITFHRVEPGFVVQGGDPNGDGTGGYSIYGEYFEDELNPESESYKEGYKEGVIAMANRGPNTNGSQFFIMLADNDALPKNYTIFGKVTEGMDIVKAITPGDKILSVELR